MVPEGWFEAATKTQIATSYPGWGYGYQWWTREGGTCGAYGIHGQLIHIDPARRLIVAINSAWPEATSPDRDAALDRMMATLAAMLDAEAKAKP